jgi:hypothetical protein
MRGQQQQPMTSPVIFDRALLRARRRRAEALVPADFLLARVAEDVAERLSTVTRHFDVAVDLGTPGDHVRRVRDTEAFFNNPSPDIARQYIERYNVDYIYVGGLERAYHSAQGLAKFDGMVGTDLREVYKRGVVTIYQVVR